MPITIPTTAQVSAVNAATGKLLSALAPTALPYIARAIEALARYPILLKVVIRAADMAGKTRRPYDPRVLGRALEAAASEVANEEITDRYLAMVPVRKRK